MAAAKRAAPTKYAQKSRAGIQAGMSWLTKRARTMCSAPNVARGAATNTGPSAISLSRPEAADHRPLTATSPPRRAIVPDNAGQNRYGLTMPRTVLLIWFDAKIQIRQIVPHLG